MPVPDTVSRRIECAIAERVFPGCVFGIVNKNGTRTVRPFGRFTYDGRSNEVRQDTIYDVASITKSIPTSSLALLLASEKKLSLDERVTAYLPQLQNDHGATIGDLLRYRVSGPALSTLKDKTADEILSYVFERGFDGLPGASNYSNLPALLLGLVIERVCGDRLDHLAQMRFFDPLGMTRTSFWPQYFSREDIAPTEIEAWRGHVQGSVHDESAYVFTVLGPRPVGHAGVFSTAPDLLNFLDEVNRQFLDALDAQDVVRRRMSFDDEVALFHIVAFAHADVLGLR